MNCFGDYKKSSIFAPALAEAQEMMGCAPTPEVLDDIVE